MIRTAAEARQGDEGGNEHDDERDDDQDDCFQLHQDENTTKTKATGGIETDTRTSGDHGHGQDNFQHHQDEDNTEDGIGDYKGAATTSKGRTTSSSTRMRTTPRRGTR